MTKRTPPPTIIAEHVQFGHRVTYNSDRETHVSRIDTDPPVATAVTQAGKLSALTCLLNGEGFDVFKCLAETHQRNLIWLIDDLAHEVCAIAQLASDMYCMTKTEVNHE